MNERLVGSSISSSKKLFMGGWETTEPVFGGTDRWLRLAPVAEEKGLGPTFGGKEIFVTRGKLGSSQLSHCLLV